MDIFIIYKITKKRKNYLKKWVYIQKKKKKVEIQKVKPSLHHSLVDRDQIPFSNYT
jgi:hypothetical protein